MKEYKIVEKKNTLAVHGYFDDYESAEYHLKVRIPDYISRHYFMDKKLNPNDFIIMEK
jgi:hypothetical protein